MSITTVLQTWRESNSLSQRDMAIMLEVSQQVYSYYEKGRSKPGANFYNRFKEVFGWDLKEAVYLYTNDPFAINRRILAIHKLLVGKGIISEMYELARMAALDVNRFSKMLQEEIDVSPEFEPVIRILEHHYFVNRAHLLFDVTPIFLIKNFDSLHDYQKRTYKKMEDAGLDILIQELGQSSNTSPAWVGVPMYDIPVTAGAVTMIRDEKAPEPAYYLQIPSFKDCTFGARVSGDSMYPEIRNGDYVVCKEVQTLESLIYGDIYLVITKDGIETVKYVHPHDNPDWVNLVPYNKSVPTTPMPKSNIFKVYKVKGVLKGY